MLYEVITGTSQAGGTASAGTSASGSASASVGGAQGAQADGAPPGGDMSSGDGAPPDMRFMQQEEVDTSLEKPTVEEINGAMVSGGFFAAYNLQAKYGDVLSDSATGSAATGVVLGADLADKLYASVTDPSQLIGMKLILNNLSYTIVGA